MPCPVHRKAMLSTQWFCVFVNTDLNFRIQIHVQYLGYAIQHDTLKRKPFKTLICVLLHVELQRRTQYANFKNKRYLAYKNDPQTSFVYLSFHSSQNSLLNTKCALSDYVPLCECIVIV